MSEWTIVTFLHMGAAAIWVGSMAVYALLITPYAKKRFDEVEYIEFLNDIGLRFRRIGWFCLGVIAVTGARLADIIYGWQAFTNAYDHTIQPVITIAWKMVLGILLIGVVAYHDLRAGPRAVAAFRAQPDSPETTRLRRIANNHARIMILISIVIFYLGVSVLRG